jgi:hypothetical protein
LIAAVTYFVRFAQGQWRQMRVIEMQVAATENAVAVAE